MNNIVLFEIGIEELPARFIDDAEKQLYDKTKTWLKEERISYNEIITYSTPRRLAIKIKGIAQYQETITKKVRGPKLNIAKTADGEWTKAAIGFSGGQGKTVEDIFVEKVKGESYTFVEKRIEGKETREILKQFDEIISSITFSQTMRWGSLSYRYARPIRWLVALYNDEIIPFEIAHVKTSNVTYGHRFLGGKVVISSPSEYETILEKQFVIANPKKRENMIVEQIKQIEENNDFYVPLNQTLLNEVRNLVEYPTAFFGEFDSTYLQLPEEVLITSMEEHQRYFAVFSKDKNKLIPYFISVRNGDETEIDNVVRGNEKVLRARLADAQFFYEEDRRHSIDIYMDKLKNVIYQEEIGTLYEKSERVVTLTEKICAKLNIDQTNTQHALRAARICKFDLVTQMVNEFPELQGIMGEKYALHFSEEKEVATALREHYKPIQAKGELPGTLIGSIVSVADKLDTVVGTISVGLLPTGSQDPYGLRRQTIGLLRIILKNKWNIPIEALIDLTAELYQVDQYKKELHTFFIDRASYILSEEGIEQDLVRAVLDKKIGSFPYTLEKARVLSEKINNPSFTPVQESFVRILNIQSEEANTEIKEDDFVTESEQTLYNTYKAVKKNFTLAEQKLDAKKAFEELIELSHPIHQFFEHNMVMDEDLTIRGNRLALVGAIEQLIRRYANITRIEWKQHS